MPATLPAAQRKEDLNSEEEYAVERLCSWLAQVQGTVPFLDDALDDAQREFLLSYRLPEAEADSTPGGGGGGGRQYILPQRTPRGGSAGVLPELAGNGVEGAHSSRACSEELEAVNDPELQEVLRAVSQQEL